MPIRDYAAPSPKRRHKKKQNPFLRRLILIVLIGLAGLTVYTIKHTTGSQTNQADTPKIKKPASPAKQIEKTKTPDETNTKAAPKVSVEPQFDFYTLLPQMEISVPKTDATKINLAPKDYLLQVAALRNLEDAKGLSDTLQAMGFMARVQTYRSTSGTQWNRVITGPYHTLKAAEDAQDKLLNEHIDSLLLQIKPSSHD